jgi:cell cycle arrest protein BUB3
MESRLSPLKSQLRCVRMNPGAKSFVCGSIEGRCAIEYVDSMSAENMNKGYSFKCHRRGDVMYPVNALAYHPSGMFASGGSDGTVKVWDGDHRKQRLSLPPFEHPIAALAFNNVGSLLAVAASHTFELSEVGDPMLNNIFVRVIKDGEVSPK